MIRSSCFLLFCIALPLAVFSQEMTTPLSHFVNFKSNLNGGFAAEAESKMFSLEAVRQHDHTLRKYAISGVVPIEERLGLFGSLSTLKHGNTFEHNIRAGISSSLQWGKFHINPSVEGGVAFSRYDLYDQSPSNSDSWWVYQISPALLLKYGSFFIGSTHHTWATDDFRTIHAWEAQIGADVQVSDNFNLTPVLMYVTHNWELFRQPHIFVYPNWNEMAQLSVTSELWNRLKIGAAYQWRYWNWLRDWDWRNAKKGFEPLIGVRLGNVHLSYSGLIEKISFGGTQQFEAAHHSLSVVWEMN